MPGQDLSHDRHLSKTVEIIYLTGGWPNTWWERTVKDFYELSSIRTYGDRQATSQRPSNSN